LSSGRGGIRGAGIRCGGGGGAGSFALVLADDFFEHGAELVGLRG
jgi:hypothetical protein